MAKKLSKEDIKGPDVFITFSDKLIEIVDKYKYVAMLVLGAGFVLGSGKVGYDFYDNHKEKEATTSFYAIEAEFKKKQEEIDKKLADEQKAIAEKNKGKKKAAAPAPPEKTPETLQSNYGPILTKYQGFVKQNNSTKAAVIASIELARVYTEHKDYENAKETLVSIEKNVKPSDFFYGLMQMQTGTVFASLNQYDQAVKHFENVLNAKEHQHLHSQALVKSGIAYEKLGKFAEAEQAYKKASDEFGTTSAGKSAKSYLRLLSINKGSNAKN